LTCKWYKIIYFYSENSQEILWITFIKTHLQIYSNLSNQSLNLTIIKFILIFFTMIRDSESVESRTAHLLKSTASRQVSLISVDTSAKFQNVAISWNINISQQLRQWAIDQLNKIIKMLIELKDQRNITLKLNEQWIDLQVDHIKRLDELKINQTTINHQEKTIVELWEKVLSLKKKQRSADQLWSQQFTESRSTTNHLSQQDIELHAFIKNHTWRKTSTKFISFENERHWFYKFLNSFIFIEEDESTWKDWRNKINDKLIVNVD